jgi:hypothetical protein
MRFNNLASHALFFAKNIGVKEKVTTEIENDLKSGIQIPNLVSLFDYLKRKNLDVRLQKIQFRELLNFKFPMLLGTNTNEVVVNVPMLTKKYTLVSGSLGEELYMLTDILEKHYTGECILPNFSDCPFEINSPIVEVNSGGVGQNVKGKIELKNITNNIISVSPEPCGCAHLPRGVITKSVVQPNETVIVSIDYLSRSISDEMRPVPMVTDTAGFPKFFLALKCNGFEKIIVDPDNIQEQVLVGENKTIEIFIRTQKSVHLKNIKWQNMNDEFVLSNDIISGKSALNTENGETIHKITFTVSKKNMSVWKNKILLYFDDISGQKRQMAVDVVVDFLPDLYVSPDELFGVIKNGTSLVRFLVLSRSNKTVSVEKIALKKYNGSNIQFKSNKEVEMFIKFNNNRLSGVINDILEIKIRNSSQILRVPISFMVKGK